MAKVLQMDFPYPGPFGKEMTEMSRELAQSIAEEPGLFWKIWTENSTNQEAGGIYLFADENSATAYLKKHTERLKQWDIREFNAKIFDINDELTVITNGPVRRAD